MSDFEFDLVIIGAGPGGYEAAFDAAASGMRTAVIEKDKVGGTCLNRGCIPTKAIMHSSDIYRDANAGAAFGVDVTGLSADLDRIIARKNQVVETLQNGILSRFKKDKITLLQGTAQVKDGHTVAFSPNEDGEESRDVTAKYIMVATGSHPFVPPIPGVDLPGVMTSDDLLDISGPVPEEMVIIGGGVIGIEFATVFFDLGTKITIIEALDGLIPTMDKELGRSLKMNLKKKGIDVHTGAAVTSFTKDGDKIAVAYKEKEKDFVVPADVVLVSTGRRSTTAGVFSDDFLASHPDFLTRRGQIVVDQNYQTAEPGIYAIGDAIGGIMLAHTATAEGRNAVAAMNGKKGEIRMEPVPSVIYTSPEIAQVGLTQDEAKEKGIKVKTRKFPMSANGKTVIEDLDRGYIKLVSSEEDDTLLGAQLMCGRASDIIAELAVAIGNGLKVADVANVIHPHPSFVEAVMDTARL